SKIDQLISAFRCKGEAAAFTNASGIFDFVYPFPRLLTCDKPVGMRIGKRCINPYSVKLNRISRIKSSVLFAAYVYRLFTPINKELELARVSFDIISYGRKFSLGDSIKTFALNGQLHTIFRCRVDRS